MIVIRGTAAFRSRVDGAPLGEGDEPTGVLGEWFANIKLWRPQVALFVHRTTFLPVVLPLAPATGVLERFGQHLDELLRALGVPGPTIAAERAQRDAVRIAPTDDRTVLGVLNEYVQHLEWHRRDLGRLGPDDMSRASLRLAGMVVGPLRDRGSTPDRAVAALLGGGAAPDRRPVRAPGRRWLTLRVELVEGRGEVLWPRPGRILLVPSSTTFAQLADAIDTAFSRWDRGHLHRFRLVDGTEIVHVDDWGGEAPDGAIDDRGRVDRLAVGDQLVYEFDLGDGWMHVCQVTGGEADPRWLHGVAPDQPLAIDGWGAVPDQYGRRFAGDDGAGGVPKAPEPPLSDLPPLLPWWGPQRPRQPSVAGDVVALLADLTGGRRRLAWDGEAVGTLRSAVSTGDPDVLLPLLLTRETIEVAHLAGAGLLSALTTATDHTFDLASEIARDLAESLRNRLEPGDDVLADQLEDACGIEPLRHLRPALTDLDMLVELLTGEASEGDGWRLDTATGRWWPADPMGTSGEEEPSHWDEPDRWVATTDAATDSAGEAWQDMWAFAGDLEDGELGARLHEAIEGPGAFRRFRRVLEDQPDDVRHHWLHVRDERRRGRARAWMARQGWAVVPPPPPGSDGSTGHRD